MNRRRLTIGLLLIVLKFMPVL